MQARKHDHATRGPSCKVQSTHRTSCSLGCGPGVGVHDRAVVDACGCDQMVQFDSRVLTGVLYVMNVTWIILGSLKGGR